MIEDKLPKGRVAVLLCVLNQLNFGNAVNGRNARIVEQCRQFRLCQDAGSAPLRRDNADVAHRGRVLRESA